MYLYLVGSRFFGTHRDDSDYDYIAEDTPQNRKLCENAGLKRCESRFVRYTSDTMDVCLASPADVKAAIYARDRVAELPNVRELTKAERHQKIQEFFRSYHHAQRELV